MEGERRGLAPMVQEEILRIAREVLRNAFRHARAHQIEAEIRYDSEFSDWLCVTMEKASTQRY